MAKYAFFLGCIAPLRYPGLEAATKKVMQHFNIELLDLNGASCCPAPGVFGSFDLWNWLVVAARNLSLGESLGADLTTICNGCYATLQEAWHIPCRVGRFASNGDSFRVARRSRLHLSAMQSAWETADRFLSETGARLRSFRPPARRS